MYISLSMYIICVCIYIYIYTYTYYIYIYIYIYIYMYTLFAAERVQHVAGPAERLLDPVLPAHSFIQGSTHAGRGSVTGARCTD